MITIKNGEDVRFNRVWLRIVPDADIGDILSRFSLFGDYKDLIEGLQKNPLWDGGFYFPLTSEVPSYLFTGNYGKQTPEWGATGKFMADALSGLLGTAGRAANAIGKHEAIKIGGHSIFGTIGNITNKAAGFVSTFTGDIDSPKIWDNTTISPVAAESLVSFETEFEYKYYKAAEIVLTLMTMPKQGNFIDTVAKIGKLINTTNGGPVSQYVLYQMEEPKSVCDISIFVGKQQSDLIKLNDVISVDSDSGSMVLFAINGCFLSSFGLNYGTETSGAGFDAVGIPRMVKYNFTLDPKTIKSVLDGFALVLASNKYNSALTLPVEKLPYYAEAATPDEIPGVSRSISLAAGFRQAQFDVGSLARAFIHNILFGNISVAAAQYVGARTINALSPVRVIVGANGNSIPMVSGVSGYLLNTISRGNSPNVLPRL